MSDVEAVDIAFYNSLKFVQENDPAPLELTFSVLEETFGQVNPSVMGKGSPQCLFIAQPTEHELKPGFGGVAVTEENKQEYVELMVRWRLGRGVRSQVNSLRQGLREMLPLTYLQDFDAHELEWVIAGSPEIDIKDWKYNTVYWGGKLGGGAGGGVSSMIDCVFL